MIKFKKKPGLVIGPTPAEGSFFMVKASELNLALTLELTYDKESAPAVNNLVAAFQSLFAEEQVGPDGHPMKLGRMMVKTPFVAPERPRGDKPDLKVVDASFEEEPQCKSRFSNFCSTCWSWLFGRPE